MEERKGDRFGDRFSLARGRSLSGYFNFEERRDLNESARFSLHTLVSFFPLLLSHSYPFSSYSEHNVTTDVSQTFLCVKNFPSDFLSCAVAELFVEKIELLLIR